jgi:hypothetical protein
MRGSDTSNDYPMAHERATTLATAPESAKAAFLPVSSSTTSYVELNIRAFMLSVPLCGVLALGELLEPAAFARTPHNGSVHNDESHLITSLR